MRALLAAAALAALLASTATAAAATPPPVVMLVMDEFSAPSLEGADGALSAKRFPNLADFAKSATWYPRASTSGDLTMRAVPSLLSGNAVELPSQAQRNLYSMLRPTHRLIRFEGYSVLDSLCAFCAAPPKPAMRLGGVMIRGVDEQATSVRGTLGAIRELRRKTSRPPLWTAHVVLPHAPYRFLPDGDQVLQTTLSRNPGVGDDKAWGPEPHLPVLSQQRFLLQAAYTDRLIGELKRDLIRGGWWDKAIVIIAADHGSSFHPNTHRRFISEESFSDIANVPLLIKYPGQSSAVVDRGSAQLIDVLPTVASVTGSPLGGPSDGLDLTGPRPQRDVRIYGGHGLGWISKSWDQFTAQRQMEVDEWNARFPGNVAATWIGPRASLRGRRVRDLAVKSSSRASARIEMADGWRDVKPGSGWIPVLVGAVLKGVPAGSPLVASLNGRIVTSGYSYRNGNRTEATLLLPASKLHRGHNQVRLLLADGSLTQLAATR